MSNSSNVPETKICFVVLPKLSTFMSDKVTITTPQQLEHHNIDESLTECEVSGLKRDYFQIRQTEMECPMQSLDMDFSTLKDVRKLSKIHPDPPTLDPGYGDICSYFHPTQWTNLKHDPDVKKNKTASNKHVVSNSTKCFTNERKKNELRKKWQMCLQETETYSHNIDKGFVVTSNGSATKLLIKSKKCENKPVPVKNKWTLKGKCQTVKQECENLDVRGPEEGSAIEGESLLYVSSSEDNNLITISSPRKDDFTKELFGNNSNDPTFDFLESNIPTLEGVLKASYKYNIPKAASQNTDLVAMSKETYGHDGYYQLQNVGALPKKGKKISPLSVYTTIFDNVISSVTCKRFKRKSSKRKLDKSCSSRYTTNDTKEFHPTSQISNQSANRSDEEVVKDVMSDMIDRVLLEEEDINFINPSSREINLFTEFCNNYGFDKTDFLNIEQVLNPQILSPDGDDAIPVSAENLLRKNKIVKTRKFGKYRRKRLKNIGINDFLIKKPNSGKSISYTTDNTSNIVTSDVTRSSLDSSEVHCLNITEKLFEDCSESSKTLLTHVNNTNLKPEGCGLPGNVTNLTSSEYQAPEGCSFSLEEQPYRDDIFSHTDTSKAVSKNFERLIAWNPNESHVQKRFTGALYNCYKATNSSLRNTETSWQNDNCTPPNKLEIFASGDTFFNVDNCQCKMKPNQEILPCDKTGINTGDAEVEVVDISLNKVGTSEVHFENSIEINTTKHTKVEGDSSYEVSTPEGIFQNKTVQRLSLEPEVYDERQEASLKNSKSESITSCQDPDIHGIKYKDLREKTLDSQVTLNKRERGNNLSDSELLLNDQKEDNIPQGQRSLNTQRNPVSTRNVCLRSIDDYEIILSDSNSEDGKPYMTQTTSNYSRPSASELTSEVEEIGSLRKHSKNVLTKSGCEIAKMIHTEVSHPEEIAQVRKKVLIDLRKNETPKSVTLKGSREETVLKTNSEINRKSGRFGGEERTNHSRHSTGQTWVANYEEPRGVMGHGSKHSKQSLLPKDILRESVLLKLLNNRKLVAPPSERNIVNNNSASTKSNILKKNTEYLHVSRPNKTESLPIRGFEKSSISDVSLCLENDSFGLSDQRTISLEENILNEKHFENIFDKQEIEITSIKDKVERLKREIFYLDLMVDQKEKEKSLIQQFKEQKEEKLKRIYHKQTLITHLTKRKMRKYKKEETSLLSVALEKQEKDESVKKTSCTEETPVHDVSCPIEQVDQSKSISCLQMNQSSYRNLVQNDSLSNDSKTFSQREQAGSTEQQNQILFDKGSVIDLSNTSFSYVTSGTILVPGNQFQNKQFLNPPQRVEIINSSTNAVPLDPNGDRAKSLGQTTFAFLNKMADGYNSSSRQNVVQRRYRKIRPKVPAIAETSSAQKTPNNEISTLSTQGSQPKVLQQVPLYQRNSISIPQSVPLSESITKTGLQQVTHSHESPTNIPYQAQLPQGNFSNVAQSLSLSENIRTGDPQTVPLLQRNSISIPQVLFPQGCLTNNSYQVPLLQRDYTYAPEINAVTVQQQVSLSQETCAGVPRKYSLSEFNDTNVQGQVSLSQETCAGVPQRYPSPEINNSNFQQQVPQSQGTCTGVPQRYPSSEMNDTNVQLQAPLSQGTCTGVSQRYPSSEMNDTNVQLQAPLSQGTSTGVSQRYPSSEMNDTNVQQQVSLSQRTCTGVPQRYPLPKINTQQQVPLSQETYTNDLQHVHLVKEKPTISSNHDFLAQGSSSTSNNQPIGEKNNVSTSSEFLNMPTELQCWKLLIACVQAITNKHSFLSPLMANQNPLLTENLANIFANLNQAIGSKNSLFGQIISNQEALTEMSSALAQDVSFDPVFSQKTNENSKMMRPTTELDNSTPSEQTTFVSAASTTSGHTTLVSPALTASGQPTSISAASTPSGQTTFVSSAPKTSEQTQLVFSAVSTSSGQTTFTSAASITSGQTTFVPAFSTPLRQTRIVSTTGQTTVLSTVSTMSGGSNNSIILSNSSVCGTCGAKDPCYICSGCQREWYCSMLCQFQNWAQHSETCRKT